MIKKIHAGRNGGAQEVTASNGADWPVRIKAQFAP
jgi:hypothetical protein